MTMKPLDEAMRRAAHEVAVFRNVRSATLSSEELLAKALASLAADGWVLVPRVATEDMLAIGKIAAVTTHRVDQVYESMVAAAPKPGETT